ncbi:MAG: hypothetical protein JXB30_04505 [Anaerolineae bacterium]|nr:hypothetical protein [Anaerolineae bacterium]
MSANAGTWFYREPENQPFMITERLNGNFWQEGIVGVYWRCVRAEVPFCAQGFFSNNILEMEWVPGEWLALKAPPDLDMSSLVASISTRILAMQASLSYVDAQDRQVFEWHVDSGEKRWQEIQGRAGFNKLRRLAQ